MRKLVVGILLSAALSASGAARIDVCPQAFDAGGWKMDVQFMDVMGSPYLLAHGAGIRVADAKAKVRVPEGGAWRVWVRSRKWVDGAGAFRVRVGGVQLDKVFGVSQSEWAWEDGGTVTLPAGCAEVRLVDGDGFDGRCAGVVLAKGGPAPEGPLFPSASAVDESMDFDFVVVGGGVPGTCAAVAAARRGLKVALVQDRPVLGGNASAEIRVWSAGEAKYPLVREVRGWFMNRDANMVLSDAHRMRVVEDEPNLSLFLCTRVFAAETDGARIAAAKGLDWRNGRVLRFAAPLFCDATGDGWLGFYAGAEWRMGREARAEFDESFAPEKADGHTLGASLMWTSATANTDIPFSAPWAEPHAQGVSAVRGEWNWEYGIRRDMIAEGEAVRDRLLLAIYGAFSIAKKDPANARLVIDTLPFLLGKRESRRLMGDWVYSEKDVTELRQFEDAIAAGSWSVDLHYDDCQPGVDFLTTCRQPHYGRYWIPYRSIYSKNIDNLFMAGRCFSCTHVGLGGPRVINTLSQLGCAAGEAAAICRERGCSPRGVWKRGLVRELQDRLGGEFPGRPDPAMAGWTIVDDEMPGVTFDKGWHFSKCANGEQVGNGAHYPPGGHSWGCDKKNGTECGEAVYPLPVAKAGRYAIKYRVPYVRDVGTDSETAIEIVSGGRVEKLVVNQAIGTGLWREMGSFYLEPGAVLKIISSRSRGVVVADGFAISPVAGFTVDADMTAGNIVVDGIEGDTVKVRQDLRDSKDWFYWAFRVRGAAGRTLKFEFTDKYGGGPVGVRGPVVSTDGGKTFSYPLDGKSRANGFAYSFGPGEDDVLFYECHPYVRANWDAFVAKHADAVGNKFVLETLCKSRKGADVPRARFGCISGKPKFRIFMSARHHCSETMASWVLEGVGEAFLADDDLGRWLRENVELMMVPFVDYDGAQAGDQGKVRKPHDHNRDYTEFLYPETKAITEWIGSHAGGRLDMFIDVHCPWVRGKYNEWLYTPWKDPKILPDVAAEHRFSALLEKLQCGTMRYRAADDLQFGKEWNTGINYAQGWSGVIWACHRVKGLKIARSYEVPFANANGAVVTPETCRDLGHDTAKVFRAMLDEQTAAGR